MLAKPTKAIGEVLDRFENKKFTCEYKYDGERAQVYIFPPISCFPIVDSCRKVHKLDDGTVSVFSRNSEDMSKKYPDLVEQLPRVCDIIPCMLTLLTNPSVLQGEYEVLRVGCRSCRH